MWLFLEFLKWWVLVFLCFLQYSYSVLTVEQESIKSSPVANINLQWVLTDQMLIFPNKRHNWCSFTFCCLGPQMEQLEVKLATELPSTAKVVACRFPFPSWVPERTHGEGIDTVWLYDAETFKSHGHTVSTRTLEHVDTSTSPGSERWTVNSRVFVLCCWTVIWIKTVIYHFWCLIKSWKVLSNMELTGNRGNLRCQTRISL